MSLRPAVLRALREAADEGVSGEALAASLRVSRVAIAKHIAALRRSGYEIAGVAGAGYTLLSSPDLPIPDEVAPLVEDAYWVRFEGGIETGSTNDDAKLLARAGAPAGTVVLASRQSCGRGRLGRAWESPDGGLYLSVVLRPDAGVADLAPVPLVISVGVAWGLKRFGIDARLKWPNDVLLDSGGAALGEERYSSGSHGRGYGKLAGVLVETSAETDRVDWLVAGVGINVRHGGARVAGAAYVTDAASAEADIRVPVVAAAVLDGISRSLAAWSSGGFEAVRDDYERLSILTGVDVVVRDGGGTVRGAGVVAGVDSLGRLLLTGPSGTVTLAAGEVTLREPGALGHTG